MRLITRSAFILLAAALLLAGCNLPMVIPSGGETPAATPDLVQTALALYTQQAAETQAASPATPEPVQPSPTGLPPAQVTATETPTALPPPSATATPTEIPSTATSIPPTATTEPTKTAISYAGPSSRTGASLTAYYLELSAATGWRPGRLDAGSHHA